MAIECITLPGIGSVMANTEAGTLQPRTHVVGQRIGIGYPCGQRELERQTWFERRAREAYGMPHGAWAWRDHTGAHVKYA